MIDSLNAEAALHPDGSRVRQLLQWAAVELPDRAARIEELEEDETSRLKECEQLREALCTIKAALAMVAEYSRAEAFSLGTQNTTFTRDFSPFVNLMAHHGDTDYGKKEKPRPHIDTRSKTK